MSSPVTNSFATYVEGYHPEDSDAHHDTAECRSLKSSSHQDEGKLFSALPVANLSDDIWMNHIFPHFEPEDYEHLKSVCKNTEILVQNFFQNTLFPSIKKVLDLHPYHTKTIDEVANLTHFHLNGKELKSLPRSVFLLKNVTSIELINNELEDLPKELSSLKNVTHINLSFNKLREFPKVLDAMVKNQSNLKIKIQNNPLTTIPEHLKSNLDSYDAGVNFE